MVISNVCHVSLVKSIDNRGKSAGSRLVASVSHELACPSSAAVFSVREVVLPLVTRAPLYGLIPPYL